jgi:hypothetical protein
LSFFCSSSFLQNFSFVRRSLLNPLHFNPPHSDCHHFLVRDSVFRAAVSVRLHKSGAIRIIVLNCAELSLFAALLSTKLSTSLLKT